MRGKKKKIFDEKCLERPNAQLLFFSARKKKKNTTFCFSVFFFQLSALYFLGVEKKKSLASAEGMLFLVIKKCF
tara:strand:+ start:440 stop:661 length:222 start_codon:yes stop_codon:yes gene_type:complete